MSDFRVIEQQEGIKILPSIANAPGIDTLEGKIGPLLNAVGGGAHFIVVPPGAYMDAHAHAKESLIYTVTGQWVLASTGGRWHMQAGALFWFGDNVPTGYENPFAEPAYLLIFKMDLRTPGYDAAHLERIKNVRHDLEHEAEHGAKFNFSELEEDHPARLFARGLGAAV